ncbi:hypothetical protein [Mesorhizobium sp. INR15]|uniref:hypothetical protein n=1 Tax=Mesorhizobium sp. INR15 TaxID=2654248 RepID=UPI0018968256|nr:hypothetical protein [Mesorhizobium sp. INR15]QPC90167.1 hypothetical protein GA829_05930 [Mesorhizobium sp. INR15]
MGIHAVRPRCEGNTFLVFASRFPKIETDFRADAMAGGALPGWALFRPMKLVRVRCAYAAKSALYQEIFRLFDRPHEDVTP